MARSIPRHWLQHRILDNLMGVSIFPRPKHGWPCALAWIIAIRTGDKTPAPLHSVHHHSGQHAFANGLGWRVAWQQRFYQTCWRNTPSAGTRLVELVRADAAPDRLSNQKGVLSSSRPCRKVSMAPMALRRSRKLVFVPIPGGDLRNTAANA